MIEQRISILNRQLLLIGNNVRPEVRDRWEKSLALLHNFRDFEDAEIVAEVDDRPAPITFAKVSVRWEDLTVFHAVHDKEKEAWKNAIQLSLPPRPAPRPSFVLKKVVFGKKKSCSH